MYWWSRVRQKLYGMKDNLGQKFKYILSECEQKQQQFTDPEFPPNSKSLAEDPSDLYRVKEAKDWKRAKDIMQGQLFMFKDGISPADINQTGLGDCQLLSTFAVIAEFPDRIEKLFNSKEPNRWGVYSVNICWRGVMQEVVVDDYFAINSAGSPFSLKTNGNELRVLVLEKAWAKLHKSYFRIDRQLAKEALHDFTGAPTRTILTNGDKEDLWKRLLEGENNGYIMCAGTIGDNSGPNNDFMRKKGLVGGHCYTLISAHMENIKGKRVRLIKLRNPWGRFVLKQVTNKEFSFKQNYKKMDSTSFKYFDEDYQDDDNHYSPTFLIVAPQPSPANPIICCKGTKRDLSSYKYIDKPIELEKGKYIAYFRVNWLNKASHSFGFGVYGPSDVKIKQMTTKFENFEQMTVACYDHEKYGKSKAKYDIETFND